MSQIMAGAVIGGLVVWYWRDDLKRYTDTRTRAARNRAADLIQTMQERAEGMIGATKQRVGSTLQAGQDAIRPRTP